MKFIKQVSYTDVSDNEDYFLDSIKNNKVLVVKNYNGDESVIDYLKNYVKKFGQMVDSEEDLVSGKTTGAEFMEISYDPVDQNQYRTAKASQPLHTDYSYINVDDNVQFLMCLKRAPIGGDTTFIDTRKLVELLIFDNEMGLYNDLLSIPVVHLKGDRIKTKTILEVCGNDYKINWNYPPAMRADNNTEAKSLIFNFKNWLDNRIEKSGLLTPVLLETNDTVFFHDYRVLHGRNSYFAKVKGDRRLVKGTLVFN